MTSLDCPVVIYHALDVGPEQLAHECFRCGRPILEHETRTSDLVPLGQTFAIDQSYFDSSRLVL